jgi:hypothetical protein
VRKLKSLERGGLIKGGEEEESCPAGDKSKNFI